MGATLKQIAEAAGVSRGTVDRVVHGRGHVDPVIEERILRLLRELDYQPNHLGRALVKSSHPLKLALICQFSETPFMKLVLAGAERARADLQALGATLLIESIASYDVGAMLSTIDRLLADGVQGLALTPGNSKEIHERMRQIIASGIPVVTLNSDAPDTMRFAYVGLDNYRAGGVAAGLLSLVFRAGGKILPISGYTENTSHSQRMKGFGDMVREESLPFHLLETQYCCDSDRLAEAIVVKELERNPDLAAIYLPGNGQAGVCRGLRRFQKEREICVLSFDMTEDNVQELKKGALDFILDQNAEEQGYRPAMLLYDKLILGKEPPSEYLYTDICIKTRFNV